MDDPNDAKAPAKPQEMTLGEQFEKCGDYYRDLQEKYRQALTPKRPPKPQSAAE